MIAPIIPYMGTKRHLSTSVVQCLEELAPTGEVADLFAGSGSVAMRLSVGRNVVANDASAFICALQRAQLLCVDDGGDIDASRILAMAGQLHAEQSSKFARRIAAEARAVNSGASALQEHMRDAVGYSTSEHIREKHRRARHNRGTETNLVLDYFGSRYFSASQAIWLDSLRQVIDEIGPGSVGLEQGNCWKSSTPWDLAVAAWLLTAFMIVNTPGHGAQYLKSTETGYRRIVRQWTRSVPDIFARALSQVLDRNSMLSRRGNRVTQLDAGRFFDAYGFGLSAAYADPPYTKDQYSRMYHLFDTLYEYDSPEIAGVGLARVGRFQSSFSFKSRISDSLGRLVSSAIDHNCALLLSYPANGLLDLSVTEWTTLLSTWADVVAVREITVAHSSLGASTGSSNKAATERLFLLK